MKRLAIVISVFNEIDNLNVIFDELLQNCPVNKQELDIIFVNDGSSDGSKSIIDSICNENPNICKAIHFSRNYGHEAAMIAGIDFADAEAIVCMDADLQHPVAELKRMFESFEDGNDIVLMQRLNNRNSILRNILHKAFYRHLSNNNSVKYTSNVSDFFLISNRISVILKHDFRERNRFIRGYIQSLGFKVDLLPYNAGERKSGKSKYTYRKLQNFSVNSLMANSNFPLVLSWYVGLIMIVFSMAFGGYSLVMYFVNKPVSGYTTIVLLISFIAAVQFLILGILGRYIALIFDEIKRRPIYLVDRLVNIDEKKG